MKGTWLTMIQSDYNKWRRWNFNSFNKWPVICNKVHVEYLQLRKKVALQFIGIWKVNNCIICFSITFYLLTKLRSLSERFIPAKEKSFLKVFTKLCVGIIRNYIIGPYKLFPKLKGVEYLKFFQNYIEQNIPLN